MGRSDRRFGDVYLWGGVKNTSSSDTKDNIQDSTLGLAFVKRLTPRQYRMKGSRVTEYGFIAQEVRDVLKNDEKLPFDGEATDSFGGYSFVPGRTEASFTKREKEKGTLRGPNGEVYERWRRDMSDNYYLNYSEFICPMVKAIQELDTKWLTDQEGGTYRTSGTVAIGTTPLTGVALRLYGGGGTSVIPADHTVFRVEGKNRNMNGLGGTVDFKLKKAQSGLNVNFISQGMHNGLKDSYNDKKLVFDLSKRFFDNQFGILICGSGVGSR